MNLSERIRPNSEAAPWVVEEVRKLEAERDKWQGRARHMETEVLKLYVTLFPHYAYTGTDQALGVIERDFTSLRRAVARQARRQKEYMSVLNGLVAYQFRHAPNPESASGKMVAYLIGELRAALEQEEKE